MSPQLSRDQKIPGLKFPENPRSKRLKRSRDFGIPNPMDNSDRPGVTSVPREECDVMLVLKFTALKFTIKSSLYRRPLALRERIFACETVEGLARSFMSFKKYKS